MGCESSSMNVEQDFTNGPRRKYCKGGISQNKRQKLLQAIEHDDACDFAVILDQYNIPFSSQLSQAGLFWMATHFCCRWNSVKVLDYILKTAYVQDPKNYINFVNDQTIQGYSCLHLCAIYNASQCLKLLIDYGGINLQLKDNLQQTPYSLSGSYKQNNIKNILKVYQQQGIGFLNIDHDQLSSGDILALQNFTVKNKKPAQFNIPLNGNLKNVIGNLFLQTQEQKNILQQKKKIQEQKEHLRLEMKKIQQQQARKESERIKQVQLQQKRRKQKEVQQNQKKIQQEMLRKERQIQKLKEDLNKIQKQKYEKAIQEQKKKSQQFLLKNQSQMQERIQLTKSMIKQQKQNVQKNRELRSEIRIQNSQIKAQVAGNLPPQLKSLYEEAKQAGVFTDKSFPQVNASLGNTDKAKKFLTDLAWLRPKEIFKGDYHLFDGIDPNDIKQGSLGVCYMLATLSTLAQNPNRIKNIFVFHDKEIGFYVLKLLIHGEIKYVVVDDAIPCNKFTKTPLFAKPVGNQLWVCLVEKAWAKCIGNYMKAESMTPNHLMQDLTTCPSFGAWFKDQTQKTKDIDTHIKLKNIVVLTSLSDRKIQGIVNNHAYSLLDVYEHQGKNIYKIRNPWGKFEWNGQYGDKSPLWTQQLKRKVGHVDSDDGLFFLSESQLLQAFVYYSISLIKQTNAYSFVPFNAKKDQNRYYTFDLDSDQQINLRFVQRFNRMLDDTNYKYSPIIFEVGKIQADGSVTFLTEGDNACFWGAKSVHANPQLLKKYEKGRYFVRIAAQWVDDSRYNTGVFAIYSSKNIKITELPLDQGKSYWIELMKSFALKKGKPSSKSNMEYIMSWMRGQLVCYAYAKQTQSAQKFEAKWTFDPSKFNNCSFALNHAGGNDIKYQMGKGPKNANVGTLKRGIINQGCSSGSVFISASSL